MPGAAPPTAALMIGMPLPLFYTHNSNRLFRKADTKRPSGYERGPIDPRKILDDDEEGAQNTGSNLFVTGIHPRLSESDLTRLFEKYGDVENCSIMVDPHSKESRGFGFVKMVTGDQADAAKEGLQGEVIEGRTLSIEKARRSRPRTPTPGKYFGPPKRGEPGLDSHNSLFHKLYTDDCFRSPWSWWPPW